MMNGTVRYLQDHIDDDYVARIVRDIESTPDGILVSPNGLEAAFLSNRPTEVFILIEALNGANFNDMISEEIREYIRQRLIDSGLDDVEV